MLVPLSQNPDLYKAPEVGYFSALLVDFLHLGCLIGSTLDLFERRQVVIVAQAHVVVVNAEAKLDHTVNATCKQRRLNEVEAGGEKRRIEEQPDKVLDGLVRLVRGGLLLQLAKRKLHT